MNQDPIVNIKLSRFLNMKGSLSVVDLLKDIVDVVVHYSHFIKPFFFCRRGDLLVVVEVHGAQVEVIETSVWAGFVDSSACGIIRRFYEK